MALAFDPRRSGKFERVIVLLSRALNVTLITAVAGAIANQIHEHFFDPQAIGAGSPLGRTIFFVAITAPIILVSLLSLGLPAAHLLRRMGQQGSFAFSLAGCGLGIVVGFAIGATNNWDVFAAYGAICALLWRYLNRHDLESPRG